MSEGGILLGQAGAHPALRLRGGCSARTHSRTQRSIARSGSGAPLPLLLLRDRGRKHSVAASLTLPFRGTPCSLPSIPAAHDSEELRRLGRTARSSLRPVQPGCCRKERPSLRSRAARPAQRGLLTARQSPDLIPTSERPLLSRGRGKETLLQLVAGPEVTASFGDGLKLRGVQRVRTTTPSPLPTCPVAPAIYYCPTGSQ